MCDTDIKPLAEALATPDTRLILSKAKRTHDALRARTASQAQLTRWRPDLQTYYQTQFTTATAHLSPEHALHLLTLCFAYKTRAGVLAFLDSVGEGHGFAWVEPLREVVEGWGRDALRRTAEDAAGEEGAGDDLEEGFEIATLGVALPKQCFLAWAMHVPLEHLTVDEMLRHPAACGLGVSREVKEEVRGRMAEAWRGDAEDFFAALCVGRSELAWCEKPRDGYGMQDVGAWVERWKGIRRREGEVDGPGMLVGKRKTREDSARPGLVKRVRWADEDLQV
ncbi:hypothetical protein DPSP01_000419 [Paraphaeosphaeria sporulosa]